MRLLILSWSSAWASEELKVVAAPSVEVLDDPMLTDGDAVADDDTTEDEPEESGSVADATAADPSATVASALRVTPASWTPPPLCPSGAGPQCKPFATVTSDRPWDGQLDRDVSGPAGIWRPKKRRRG